MSRDWRRNEDRLISGKLRSKAARGAGRVSTVTVDGVEYVWSLRHTWYVRGAGNKAWSISIALRPDRTRELILEFALDRATAEAGTGDTTLLAEIANGIRLARDGGWDPESRGRPFRFTLGDLDEPGGGPG